MIAVAACCLTTDLYPQAQDRKPEAHTRVHTIRPGDKLRVSVWREPELSVSVQVARGGTVYLPLIGTINVEGLKPDELARECERELKMYLRNPRVACCSPHSLCQNASKAA